MYGLSAGFLFAIVTRLVQRDRRVEPRGPAVDAKIGGRLENSNLMVWFLSLLSIPYGWTNTRFELLVGVVERELARGPATFHC